LTLPRSFDVIIFAKRQLFRIRRVVGNLDRHATYEFSFAERISIHRMMPSMRAHPQRDSNSFLGWRPCWPGQGVR
jgi:hypothetical protein